MSAVEPVKEKMHMALVSKCRIPVQNVPSAMEHWIVFL